MQDIYDNVHVVKFAIVKFAIIKCRLLKFDPDDRVIILVATFYLKNDNIFVNG